MNIRSNHQTLGVRWIGLAQVRSNVGNEQLGDAVGAVVAVVGDAADKGAFLVLATAELRADGFELVGLEDVERLADREARVDLPAGLRRSIESLSLGSRLALGTFHAFDGE